MHRHAHSHHDFGLHLEAAGVQQLPSLELYPHLHRPDQPHPPGLPLLRVENTVGRAVLALQGAQVLSFQPVGQPEMLWLSPRCVLAPGQAIRGGIPLCLPWFGPAANGAPAHGFARIRDWTLLNAQITDSGATRLVLELSDERPGSPAWPHAFAFRLEIHVGQTLALRLSVENRSQAVAPLAWAFHTYFAVDDVRQARVQGLDGSVLIDKLDGLKRQTQAGEVAVHAATDRIYLDVAPRQTLTTPSQRVQIDSDAACAVVWNAWTNDRTIPDIGEGNHAGYLCVERGDLADRALALAPGASLSRWMQLSCLHASAI